MGWKLPADSKRASGASTYRTKQSVQPRTSRLTAHLPRRSELNVLTWLDSLHATDESGAVTNQKWPEAQEAKAALIELIEAATEAFNAPDVMFTIASTSERLADRLEGALADQQVPE